MKHYQLNHSFKRNACSGRRRYCPNPTREICTHATDADVHLEKDHHRYDVHWGPLNLMDASADTDGYPLPYPGTLILVSRGPALSDIPVMMPEGCRGSK